ncbi:ras association domain-containing protein 8 [Salvelinus namaycush]|uniref:Ras association domain-containing protein 8 n=1 Tax=Salvelinus namaycush TaxID=8040 RepID=A0A8U1EY03_SALNM|nr:ras association domain-containing protein 8 [Salvelinus namaycush]
MEVKVSVEGVPRVVCGVTEKTTCQEVVIALAQSLGRPGRYTLQEKFKEFKRNVTPNERLLESLEKYGQQAREIQLTLLHNGPSLWEGPSRGKGCRYEAGPQLRRADAVGKVQRVSGGLSLHRQSLPPLSCLRQQAEQRPEEPKRPKRKSLTLMEEAWGWLESIGRGAVNQSGREKGSRMDTVKRDGCSLNVSVTVAKDPSTPGVLQSKFREKSAKSTEHQRISCCMGNQGRDREKSNLCNSDEGNDIQHVKKHPEVSMAKIKAESQQNPTSALKMVDEKRKLRALVAIQQASLKELQVQITCTDSQIHELEEQRKARQADQEAQQKIVEEAEHLEFWKNELKAEEGYEKDLQEQFLEMKVKAVECKAKLEEYKRKMQGLDSSRDRRTVQEEQVNVPSQDATSPATAGWKRLNEALNQSRSLTVSVVNTDRKFAPRVDSSHPHAVVLPNQIKELQPSGPSQLRDWWTCWSEAQSPNPETQPRVVHLSEIMIHLGSTRV